MSKVVKILLSVLLSLVALFCLIAIIGAFNLDPGEHVLVGRLIAVIVGLVVSVGLMVRMWRSPSATP